MGFDGFTPPDLFSNQAGGMEGERDGKRKEADSSLVALILWHLEEPLECFHGVVLSIGHQELAFSKQFVQRGLPILIVLLIHHPEKGIKPNDKCEAGPQGIRVSQGRYLVNKEAAV